MLFDEVTSALDPELVGEVLTLLAQLKADGMTMMVDTHEMAFAREVADQVVFLESGVIVEMGPPEKVFDDPVDPRTRRFLRRVCTAQDPGPRTPPNDRHIEPTGRAETVRDQRHQSHCGKSGGRTGARPTMSARKQMPVLATARQRRWEGCRPS